MIRLARIALLLSLAGFQMFALGCAVHHSRISAGSAEMTGEASIQASFTSARGRV